MPCRSARRCRPGTRSRWRCCRTPGCPTRAAPAAPRPRTRSRAHRLPTRRATRTCSRSLLLVALSSLCRREPCQHSELLVARAARERDEALAVPAVVEPALDQAFDRDVEVVGRYPPEERPPDLRRRPERAAHEDVVGLPPRAALVARRRSLEAEVADPVLRTRVRAAVEVQAQVGDLHAEALVEPVDQPAEACLRLGDREVAVRLAGARDRVAPHGVDVEREADALELGDGVVD